MISAAFWGGVWGGVWGIALAVLEPRLGRDSGWLLAGLPFGAVAPTLVVGPIKGRPDGAFLAWPGISVGSIVNGAWGLGTALLLRLLPASRVEGRLDGSRL